MFTQRKYFKKKIKLELLACSINIYTKEVLLGDQIRAPLDQIRAPCLFYQYLYNYKGSTFLDQIRACLFYQYVYKESTFGDQIRTWGTAMLVCSLPMKSRKRQARDVFDIFSHTWYTSLVQDITDSDCWPQNGSTHGHNYCHNFQTSIFNKEDEKSRQNCCVYILHLVLINKTILLQFGSLVFLILQWKVTMFLLILKQIMSGKCGESLLVVNCTTNVFMNLFLW